MDDPLFDTEGRDKRDSSISSLTTILFSLVYAVHVVHNYMQDGEEPKRSVNSTMGHIER
jgi:hypothetical protein